MLRTPKPVLVAALAALGFWSCASVNLPERPASPTAAGIIPRPWQMAMESGSFALVSGTPIIVPEGTEAEAAVADLKARMAASFGLDLPVARSEHPASSPAVLFKTSGDPLLGPEGYKLRIRTDGITLEAGTDRGFLHGVQTIYQLCPATIFDREGIRSGPPTVPCLSIVDRPRFAWRGVLLDVSRHFFTKAFVLHLLDELAMHKMNVLHWHLTDDQGWRVEIKRYPKLTEVGAWRVDREDRHWNAREPQKPGERATYGGFYTQDEIREVVAYAARRGITVIPEIELPGHCLSALAAYPELSCSGGPFTVPPGGVWPIKDVYCAGNETVFQFLENVLTEVLDLFPSPVIHIGGDEVDKSTWKACPKCQARMAAEGLKSEEELQSYFIKRIERFLNGRGRTLLGWDEILEGGLAPRAMVMSWRGTQGGIQAARTGHDVVMTPTSHCYFDYYQGQPFSEPLAIGGYLPLGKVHAFEPAPADLSPEEAKRILGVQANLWTEYVATPSHARYMLYPRLAAMAEAGWSPAEGRDWNDFCARLAAQFGRYEAAGMNYARSLFAVRMKPDFDAEKRECVLSIETESSGPELRYTLNGAPPTPRSRLYPGPLRLKKTTVVKAGAFLKGRPAGPVGETRFAAHAALGRKVSLAASFSGRYDGGGPLALVDGLRGSPSHTDGRWQGFEGVDLEAVIDLGKVRRLRRVETAFLQNTSSWIFSPESVEVAVSRDGQAFETAARLSGEPPAGPAPAEIKSFAFPLETKARFVRLSAKNIALCPPWHAGAGGKAWLFADEIIVD